MLENLNLNCLNCRGLRDKHKRQAVFLWLKQKGAGIYFLQEAHSSTNSEHEWSNQWDGKIIYSHGNSNSRGVLFLVSKDIDISINNIERDNYGRFLVLDAVIAENRYIFVNLYALTSDKREEQVNFGEYIFNNLQKYIGENIIIGGDLNIDLDIGKPYNNLSKNPGYYKQFISLIEVLNLVDIWRLKNPDAERYTWREKTRYGFSQSRIDFFLISCHLQYYTETTQILPGIKSDHSLLKLSLFIKDEPKRGRGVWKLNVSLLQDKQVIVLIKETIGKAIIDSINLSDSSLVWDFIKYQIRTEAISYSIKKSKESNNYLANMSAKLCMLEDQISSTPTVEKVEEYNLTKNIIDNIYNERLLDPLFVQGVNLLKSLRSLLNIF